MLLLSTLVSLLLPLDGPVGLPDDRAALTEQAEDAGSTQHQSASSARPWIGFDGPSETPIAEQVRIERRVILRVSPRPGRVREDFASRLRQGENSSVRLIERPAGNCIATRGIAGVSDRGSRLIMYMRDRSMVSATLERSCSPRDFYLGFYLERNEDGLLCTGRDRLMSRAGARCRVTRMSRLQYVPVEE